MAHTTAGSELRRSGKRPHRCSRTAAGVASLVLLVGAALACAPPTGGPTFNEGRCAGAEGVTVVVDFVSMQDRVVVRCALGPQASGFAALTAVGLAHDPGQVPGGICQIDGLPTQGYPYCWTTGGYWSYWKASSAGAPWTYSSAGATTSALPAGAVEGWRFAPFAAGSAEPPRVGTSGPIAPA